MLGALFKLRPKALSRCRFKKRARVIGVWQIARHRRFARLVRADV